MGDTPDPSAVLGTFDKRLHAAALGRGRHALGGGGLAAHLCLHESGRTVELAHHRAVFALAFAPNGEDLATGSGDMGVRIFGPSGELRCLIEGHMNRVVALAWAGDRLASGSWDGTVRVHRWVGGEAKLEWVARELGAPMAVAWWGDALVVGTTDSVLLLDGGSGERRVSVRTEQVWAIRSSPDGAHIGLELTGHDHAARASKHHVRIMDRELTTTWEGAARGVAFDPDGRFAVGEGGRVRVRDRGELVVDVEAHAAAISTITSTESGWLTGAADGTLRLSSFDGAGRGERQLGGPVALCAARGGELFAVTASAEVCRWTVAGAWPPPRPVRKPLQPERRLNVDGTASSVAIDDWGRVLVTSDEGLQVFDLASGERVQHLLPGSSTFGVTRSKRLVVTRRQSAAKECAVFEAQALRHMGDVPVFEGTVAGGTFLAGGGVWRVDGEGSAATLVRVKEPEDSPSRAALSDDGGFAAIGAAAGALLLNVTLGETRPLGAQMRAAAFSPDGAMLALTTSAGEVVLHDRVMGTTASLPPMRAFRPTWADDGRHFAMADLHQVRVFDRSGGQVAEYDAAGVPVWLPGGDRLFLGSGRATTPALVSLVDDTRVDLPGLATRSVRARIADGRIVTHCSSSPASDVSLLLWTFAGERVARLGGHTGPRFVDVAVSEDGCWIASSVEGDVVRLWRASDGEGWRLPRPGRRPLIAFGGGRLATVVDGVVELWSLEPLAQEPAR